MELLWLPTGPYDAGWALDWHTVSAGSRTSIGERLYLLKYRYDRSQIEPLARTLAEALSTRIVRPRLHAIVPIPPSNTERPFQPVLELARCLAQLTGISLVEDYLVKVKPTPMLKNIESATGRRQELEGVFDLRDPYRLAGAWVLLFDDLYQTGATLGAATKTLKEQGHVSRVYALVVTRTRTRPTD
ncbi:hypothetical protein OO015_05620 [Thermomicrobium sp. 4228-Ro]|uniref:ComF family protein n=1 Tax=Thermomicrobium sp. 4228-Ro TaxID=2993937 RepID=UPI002248EC57|nr:hypothetical protein [Thermomicrobium sp. 4228-Ro]MCX2726973.1 hypothetical protein [Thermomicrobium sp. 4228-Ro]